MPVKQTWNTQEEYEEQINLPTHIVEDIILFEDGTPHYETMCGLVLGSELFRTTDIYLKHVTCLDCIDKDKEKEEKKEK